MPRAKADDLLPSPATRAKICGIAVNVRNVRRFPGGITAEVTASTARKLVKKGDTPWNSPPQPGVVFKICPDTAISRKNGVYLVTQASAEFRGAGRAKRRRRKS